MANVEKSGYMKYKDKSGNMTTMYPKTKVANVEGLSDELAKKAPTSHTHTRSQISDFPTSMPASDVKAWAKADVKPSYTASEVGAAPASHSHSAASTSAAGFMSAADKSKLNGIATGANKTTVDTAMSNTSTNPVQNKVIAAAIQSAIQSAIQNTWEASY